MTNSRMTRNNWIRADAGELNDLLSDTAAAIDTTAATRWAALAEEYKEQKTGTETEYEAALNKTLLRLDGHAGALIVRAAFMDGWTAAVDYCCKEMRKEMKRR